MPKSLKDPTTYTEQLARFQSRNMVVDDEAKALLDLRACNYYRVCGYCYQFFNAKGNYKNGTSFEVVMRLYHFDSRLRHILLIPLESAEIYARTMIAYGFRTIMGQQGIMKNRIFEAKPYTKLFGRICMIKSKKTKTPSLCRITRRTTMAKCPLGDGGNYVVYTVIQTVLQYYRIRTAFYSKRCE